MSRTYSKEDVEFHSDGFGPSHPAVNVKVYKSLEDGYREFRKANPDTHTVFTDEWIRENISEDSLNSIWEFTCENGWEELNDLARGIWGRDQHSSYKSGSLSAVTRYRVNVYSEGRSGGWAYVDGINDDVNSWDAIALSKWRKFSTHAKMIADGIMYQVVESIYLNEFPDDLR